MFLRTLLDNLGEAGAFDVEIDQDKIAQNVQSGLLPINIGIEIWKCDISSDWFGWSFSFIYRRHRLPI